MKITQFLKYSALAVMALGMAVGCASAPKEEPQQVQEQPSVADAQAAIASAKAAVEKAKAAGALWRDTGDMIAEAEKALADGDAARAIELANRARKQAENALVQHQREMERLEAERAKAAAKPGNYTVMRGDSLWSISGKEKVYGNPYQWPLIYKANRDKIRDADLIFPGQNFSIDRGASAGDIDAAVRHAKTRGAWSLGTVEQSDLEYARR